MMFIVIAIGGQGDQVAVFSLLGLNRSFICRANADGTLSVERRFRSLP